MSQGERPPVMQAQIYVWAKQDDERLHGTWDYEAWRRDHLHEYVKMCGLFITEISGQWGPVHQDVVNLEDGHRCSRYVEQLYVPPVKCVWRRRASGVSSPVQERYPIPMPTITKGAQSILPPARLKEKPKREAEKPYKARFGWV
eukprot:SM000064S19795  [mRNA]  locus=s64:575541:576656:+ [translate_table: standard]